MNSYYLNLALLIIDFVGIALLLSIWLFFSKSYYSYHVPRINSYNDVISSKEIERIINQFKNIYKMEDYEIIYVNTNKHVKLFKNLDKKKKQITISKKIFESVGYEIDYIISRLWISAKKNDDDQLIKSYRILIFFIPAILIVIMLLATSFNIFLIVYFGNSEDTNTYSQTFLGFFWNYPIAFVIYLLCFITLFINHYLSMKVKEKLEFEYNNEVIGIVKLILKDYIDDFVAARTYAQNFKIAYFPIYKQSNFWESSKWLGPFVRL